MAWALPAVSQIAFSMFVATNVEFGSPLGLFWIVVIAASACVITSVALLIRSFASNEAELGALAAFFYSVSLLPLVHGFTTPGVLVGDNTTTMTSVILSIPMGLVAVAPFAVPRSRHGHWFRRHWRGWVAGCIAAVTALGAALVIDLDLLPAPSPREPVAVTLAIASFLGCVMLSYRHLRLARIAGRPGPLIVSAGCGFVGASAFVWLSLTPFSTGFWVAHALDIAGVLGATVGALVVYRRTSSISGVLEPVLVTDPLAALEIGMDPLVHRFVVELEAKDEITRNHVVRTGALAVKVAEELRLDACSLRRVGLTAVLHDVGKLEIPDEILTKPGRLTDEEFDVIRSHTDHGARLVSSSSVLREVASSVRAHHERIDGCGYPDGLAGHAIPLDARIVAACDAFDAMANTRQYRQGMGHEKALSILAEHSGAQWDPVVVAALDAVVRREPPTSEPDSALDRLGRRMGCDCLPEPDQLDQSTLSPV